MYMPNESETSERADWPASDRHGPWNHMRSNICSSKKVSSSSYLMAMKDEIQAAYPNLTDEELYEMLAEM